MKITNKQLIKLIQEELQGVLGEEAVNEEQVINESQKEFYQKLFRLIYDFRRTAFTDHADMVRKVNGSVAEILKKMEKAPNIGQTKADQANAQSSVIIDDPEM